MGFEREAQEVDRVQYRGRRPARPPGAHRLEQRGAGVGPRGREGEQEPQEEHTTSLPRMIGGGPRARSVSGPVRGAGPEHEEVPWPSTPPPSP